MKMRLKVSIDTIGIDPSPIVPIYGENPFGKPVMKLRVFSQSCPDMKPATSLTKWLSEIHFTVHKQFPEGP
jgi:hypothetical protein